MQIVPIRELKNTANFEKLCKEENGPVFVTKNGYGSLVVMDIDYYEKTLQKTHEAQLILQGLSDVNEGKTTDFKSVLDEMRTKYDL